MNMTPGGPSSVQLNVGGEGKKIDYSKLSPSAANWGRGARYAAAIPAAWSALSTLAGDGREDLFTTLGQAGLSASATHNIARGALEPAAARFGERRNLKNNPTHYNEKGEYIGPPSQNNSGTMNAEFTEEEISPTQLPENASGTNIASPEGKPPIEMVQNPEGVWSVPPTGAMHQAAVEESQKNSLTTDPVYPNNPGGVDPWVEANRSIMGASGSKLYGNYGQ